MKVICTTHGKSCAIRTIEDHELELIAGGYLIPGALLGAFSGAALYTTQAVISDNFSTGKLIGATLSGAAAGFVGGPVTVARAIWTMNVAVGTGAIYGVAEAQDAIPKKDTSYWSDFAYESVSSDSGYGCNW